MPSVVTLVTKSGTHTKTSVVHRHSDWHKGCCENSLAASLLSIYIFLAPFSAYCLVAIVYSQGRASWCTGDKQGQYSARQAKSKAN